MHPHRRCLHAASLPSRPWAGRAFVVLTTHPRALPSHCPGLHEGATQVGSCMESSQRDRGSGCPAPCWRRRCHPVSRRGKQWLLPHHSDKCPTRFQQRPARGSAPGRNTGGRAAMVDGWVQGGSPRHGVYPNSPMSCAGCILPLQAADLPPSPAYAGWTRRVDARRGCVGHCRLCMSGSRVASRAQAVDAGVWDVASISRLPATRCGPVLSCRDDGAASDSM